MVERIGSPEWIQAAVRVIAASKRNLQEQFKSGKFREDLYFRLAVFPIHVAELSKRPLDILPLADFFLSRYRLNIGRDQLSFSEGAKKLLQTYSWPGNVRELENIVQRAVLLADGDQILAEDLELDDAGIYSSEVAKSASIDIPPVSNEALNTAIDAPKSGTNIASSNDEIGQDIDSVEREHILKVLAKVDGNRTKAVEILGISARALRYKLKYYKEAGFIND